MKKCAEIILLIVQRASYICILGMGIIGAIYEVLNPPVFEQVLAKINVTWSLSGFYIAFLICLVVMIVSSLLKKHYIK